MRVIADLMGADEPASVLLRGALDAKKSEGIELTVVGSREEIESAAKTDGLDLSDVEIIDAPTFITMHDDPSAVLHEKKDSSMAMGLRMLREGKGDAFVSSGSTGALLTGATLIVKRIRGVRRAALATPLPTKTGSAMLIDCGANTECTPEMLLQFAIMGSAYASIRCEASAPSVGLLNIGAEETKGRALQRDSYKLFSDAAARGVINFAGNVEPRYVPMGQVDVVVTDGFTGNVLLKTYEGVGMFFMSELKSMFTGSLSGKIAGLLVKPKIKALKERVDYKETGGAPLLGISRPVMKAHGSADERAFAACIRQAVRYASANVISHVSEGIAAVSAEAENA